MISAKCSDFLTPPTPHCLHLDLIYTIKFTHPPIQRPLLTPSDADIISGSSLKERNPFPVEQQC